MLVKNNRGQDVILAECQVKEKYFISPHMIRIVLQSDEIKDFDGIQSGVTIKLFFPHPELEEVIFPKWLEVEGKLETDIPSVYRTFTMRHLNIAAGELWIDFVDHGDLGYASWWATTAEPGDIIAVATKKRETDFKSEKQNVFLIADHTGLPFISAILEKLNKEARGEVVIEVPTPDDILDLQKPENVKLHWLINPTPGENSHLEEKARELEFFPSRSRYAVVAAEFTAVRNLRNYFRKELDWALCEVNALSYWKKGKSETESVFERMAETSHE